MAAVGGFAGDMGPLQGQGGQARKAEGSVSTQLVLYLLEGFVCAPPDVQGDVGGQRWPWRRCWPPGCPNTTHFPF